MDQNRTPQKSRYRASRHGRSLRLGSILLLAACPAFAASTGGTALVFVGNAGRPAPVGDYISATVANGGIVSPYRYWIEVPPSLSRLRVQLFDADVGDGGVAESSLGRDRLEGVTSNSVAVYTLVRPNGTTAATLTCSDTGVNPCVAADNVWTTLFDSTTDKAAGHWEVRIDMTSNAAGQTVNSVGIRADDGDAAATGTELNVYFDSFTIVGINGDEANTVRTYAHYPYITSGCTFAEDDYDYDVGGGNTGLGAGGTFGQVGLTSRSGAVTRTIASANLSSTGVWKSNTVARWTTDGAAIDYGIWAVSQQISSFLNSGGTRQNNYASLGYTTDQSAAGNPATNPAANALRVYLPTDAGAAPPKPYLEQLLTCTFCAGNPISVGATSTFQVTVRLVNPAGAGTATFSAPTNVVTVLVPGGQVLYFGNAAVSQGTITGQPAVGGSGTITWNPGTVSAGSTVLLTYQISVTPTAAGRIVVTGTPSANGTSARFVDLTGNTTQARSTYATGGLCELAADTAIANPAVVSSFAVRRGPAGVVVAWTTASEIGTTGFDLYRFEPAARSFVRQNEGVLPALVAAPQGGSYRWLDRGAPQEGFLRYRLVEHLAGGGTRAHGPFLVAVAPPQAADEESDPSAFLRAPRAPTAPAAETAEAGRLTADAPRANGSAPSVKIGIGENGLYRLTAARLADVFGLPEKEIAGRIAQRRLRLTHQGAEIPWWGDGSGLLFYGRAAVGLYARDNVYWLAPDAAADASWVPAGNPVAPAAIGSFVATLHLERDRFAATAVATDPEADYWYWDYLIAGDPVEGSKSFPVDLPGLLPGTVRLTVHLQGATRTGTPGEHHAVVRVNGSEVGETRWTGIAAADPAFDVPAALLRETGNALEVAEILDTGAAQSIAYVNGFDLAYPRRAKAADDALELTADGAAPLTVGGFSAPAVVLLDITQPDRPRRVEGALATAGDAGSSVTFVPGQPGGHYFAAGPTALQEPRWLAPGRPPQLKTADRGADYLVITTAALRGPAEQLAALRTSQGLASRVVDIEDVMDEFNYGMTSPRALADFLAYARRSWRPAPRYAVLAGAGNFDYRDLLGLGGNLLPPILVATPAGGLFASDLALTAGGDRSALSVGRIPVTTAADFAAYVEKLRAYETTPPDTTATDRAVLLADADATRDFAPDAERLAGFLPPNFDPQRIFLSRQPIAEARDQLFAALASGVGLVTYIGHGALDRMSAQGLWSSADIASLPDRRPASLVTAFTCVLNRFEVPGFTPFGAALVTAGHGGALAIFAPTGLNENATGRSLAELFYRTLSTAGSDVRLGDVVKRTMIAYRAGGGTDPQADLYTLLGDPALRLQRQAPPPQPPIALPPDPKHPSG